MDSDTDAQLFGLRRTVVLFKADTSEQHQRSRQDVCQLRICPNRMRQMPHQQLRCLPDTDWSLLSGAMKFAMHAREREREKVNRLFAVWHAGRRSPQCFAQGSTSERMCSNFPSFHLPLPPPPSSICSPPASQATSPPPPRKKTTLATSFDTLARSRTLLHIPGR